ncbi:MAG TPA: ABC transporter permease subunit [Acidimicrobiales bacterium]|nr:ABC transporter permease subunit [Acidimicrobiales bacterium]
MSGRRALTVAARLLADRRRALLWWCVGFVAFLEVNVVFYPSVKDQSEFDQMMNEMPESLRVLMGITEDLSITSPVGYLQSQLFAMFFALLLLIYGLGLAANAIAGAEQDGRLEYLLVQPVTRLEVALGRWLAVCLLVTVLTLSGFVALAVTNPLVGLDEGLPLSHLFAASFESLLLALVFTALGFAVGAWTGHKGQALALASAVAVVTFLLNGFGDLVALIERVRVVSPWHWYAGDDPLANGFGLQGTVLPILTIALVVAAGCWRLDRRDLR